MGQFTCFTSIGSATGEIVAPRYDIDGTVNEGIIFYIDTVGQDHKEMSNDFVPVPKDWRDQWTEANIATIPTGAHDYLDAAAFGLTGQAIAIELAAAHDQRMVLLQQRVSGQ